MIALSAMEPTCFIDSAMLEDSHKKQLLKLAAASIKYGLEQHKAFPVNPTEYPPALQQIRASFVTLTIHQKLRGCIGTLEARCPLVTDVTENAFAAAFRDPRFSPLQESEYQHLHYHISVLNPPHSMQFHSEADLISQLRPGIDGLILEDLGRKGTFLPSVWESLPEPADFIRHLKNKAGLSSSHWSPSLKIQRYTVEDIE